MVWVGLSQSDEDLKRKTQVSLRRKNPPADCGAGPCLPPSIPWYPCTCTHRHMHFPEAPFLEHPGRPKPTAGYQVQLFIKTKDLQLRLEEKLVFQWVFGGWPSDWRERIMNNLPILSFPNFSVNVVIWNKVHSRIK